MNQRESVLVYAVTAILAVLVIGAVVFADDTDAASNDGQDGSGKIAVANPADLLGGEPPSGEDSEGAGEGAAGDGEDGEPSGEGRDDGASTELSAAEQVAQELRGLLGDSRVIDYGAGPKFRQVRVRRGDTLSQLVERWTGSLELMPDVQAMNETLDPESMPVNTLVNLPWVADELLLQSARRRSPLDAPLRRSFTPEPATNAGGNASGTSAVSAADLLGGSAPAGPAPGDASADTAAASTAAATTYEIQEGESLWTIAARRVGRGKADAYVKEIVRANAKISDASRIRAGDRIVLP